MVKFVKINEVYTKIICDMDLRYQLADVFAKFVPNYKYNPLFKAKVWDGKIRFVNQTTGLFYNGLLKDVWLKCKEFGYSEFEFENFDKTEEFTEAEILKKLESFNMPYEYYDYQLETIIEALTKKCRLFESATNSGKSNVIYSIARILEESDKRVLIMVPSVMLVNQLYNDFVEYAKESEYNIEDNVHKIFSGQEKFVDKGIVISTWQSILSLAERETKVIKGKKKSVIVDDSIQREFLESFDCILADEVHGYDSSAVKEILEKPIYATYKCGFTGTLNDESKSLPETLIGLFGKVTKVISARELIDSGRATPIKIVPCILHYPNELRKLVSTMDYQEELDTLIGLESRNNYITKLATNVKGNTIILLRHIDKHAKPLQELLQKATNKTVILIDKDTKADIREDIRQSLETLDDIIVIATYRLIGTGVSIKNLRNIIYAAPLKARVAIIQSIGRLIRLLQGKDKVFLFDIVDDLEYNGISNYALDHFRIRFDIYMNEQHEVDLREYNIG